MTRQTLIITLLINLLVVTTIATPARSASEEQIKSSIQKATGYLRGILSDTSATPGGQTSFAVYAILKGGVAPNDPVVVRHLSEVVAKVQAGTYKPHDAYEGIYEAGADLMALEATHEDAKYRDTMQAIVNYLIQNQLPNGSWYYPTQTQGAEAEGGDTSIAQYALLGLWAAQRAGIEVPKNVWAKAGEWHLATQAADSGFYYHPRANPTRGTSHTMTTAGGGSLLIVRHHLYPNYDPENPEPETPASPESKKSPLEQIDISKPKPETNQPTENLASVPLTALNRAANSAADWIGGKWTVSAGTNIHGVDYNLYYLYGLERFLSLAQTPNIKGHDWYAEGADFLVTRQLNDGTWAGHPGARVVTCFGLLFLVRATGRTINAAPPAEPAGSGLLAGGRGLPENLGEIKVKNGEVQQEKITSPLDQLLADLANPDVTNLDAVQEAVIEQVQIGDRELLIQQKDLLIRLVKHPEVEVRRTAYWALGRCDDLDIVPLLISGLDDPDLGVAVEARNALCILSRKPRGLGETDDPLFTVGQDSPEPEKLAAANKWRADAKTRWSAWHFSTRPYADQDDFTEALFNKP